MSFSLDQVITPEAKAALREERRVKHRQKGIAFLRTAYPVTTADLDDAQLDDFVRLAHRQVDLGRLRSERSVLNHLVAMMVLGPEFNADPAHSALIQRRIAKGDTMPTLGGHALLTYADDWAEWCRADAADRTDLAIRIDQQAARLARDATSQDIKQAVCLCLPKWSDILRYHDLFDARIDMDLRRFGPRVATAGDLCAAVVASLHLGHRFDTNPIYRRALLGLAAGAIAQCLRDVPAAYMPQEPRDD